MIKKLTLTNYESHKETILEFVPGLNIFIGATDAGKSAIFRAFKKLYTNKPGGQRMFPLYWKGEPNIKAVFDDCTIIRNISKNTEKNTYQLNEQEPVGAGTSVPEEILTAINMDDVNFQTQIERAFLMFETPGERGRILNSVAGLDDIDRIMSIAKSDEQRLGREYSAKTESLIQLESDLGQFNDIEIREQKILVCEQIEKAIHNSWNRKGKLEKIIAGVKVVDEKLETLNIFLKSRDGLEQAKTLFKSISEAMQRAGRINKIISRISQIDRELEHIPDIPLAFTKIQEAKRIQRRIDKHNDKAKNIKIILTKLYNIDNDIEVVGEEIKLLKIDIKETRKALPAICDKCGQEIPE